MHCIRDLKDHIEELDEKLNDMFLENQSLASKMNGYLEELSRYKLREYEIHKSNEERQKAITELKVSETELDFQLNQLKKEANTLKLDLGHMEGKLERTKDKRRKFKAELGQTRAQLEEALKEKEGMKQYYRFLNKR